MRQLAVLVLISLIMGLVVSETPMRSPKDCMWCTIVVRGLEKFLEYNHGTVEQKLSKYCDLFDKRLASLCKLIIAVEGYVQICQFTNLQSKPLIELLERVQDPDIVCQEIGFCQDKTCNLYPKSTKSMLTRRIKDEPWWKKLIDQLVEKFKERKPLIDMDGDGFSTIQSIRGTLWRGKDCNDMNQQIHPGRKWSKELSQVDYNCNGIHGTDGSTAPYKLSLCGGGVNRGVAVIGDSGSAHFRIPEQLLNPAYMDSAHYKHILTLAESEADWPHLSWVTGYFDKDVTDLTPGPVDSIYKRMVQRNRCIHRDYQNVAVNGASSNNVLNYMQRLSRNQSTDEPLLVFFALIGNDVCGEHPGLERQTTPEKFYANIKNGLDFLETKLPANSYGLAAGNYLFDLLHNQTHPLGITFEQLYRYQNCLVVAPCWGWMSLNQTIRDLTTKRAQELSAVYPKIINDLSGNYKNFKMLYHDFPMQEIAQEYAKTGKPLTDLIEPFDGFHPSQTLQSLMAKYLWEWLESEHPDALGPVNPNNDIIIKLFGDQGGY